MGGFQERRPGWLRQISGFVEPRNGDQPGSSNYCAHYQRVAKMLHDRSAISAHKGAVSARRSAISPPKAARKRVGRARTFERVRSLRSSSQPSAAKLSSRAARGEKETEGHAGPWHETRQYGGVQWRHVGIQTRSCGRFFWRDEGGKRGEGSGKRDPAFRNAASIVVVERTSQNLAPIWLPHWPAWRWTISLMAGYSKGAVEWRFVCGEGCVTLCDKIGTYRLSKNNSSQCFPYISGAPARPPPLLTTPKMNFKITFVVIYSDFPLIWWPGTGPGLTFALFAGTVVALHRYHFEKVE